MTVSDKGIIDGDMLLALCAFSLTLVLVFDTSRTKPTVKITLKKYVDAYAAVTSLSLVILKASARAGVLVIAPENVPIIIALSREKVWERASDIKAPLKTVIVPRAIEYRYLHFRENDIFSPVSKDNEARKIYIPKSDKTEHFENISSFILILRKEKRNPAKIPAIRIPAMPSEILQHFILPQSVPINIIQNTIK